MEEITPTICGSLSWAALKSTHGHTHRQRHMHDSRASRTVLALDAWKIKWWFSSSEGPHGPERQEGMPRVQVILKWWTTSMWWFLCWRDSKMTSGRRRWLSRDIRENWKCVRWDWRRHHLFSALPPVSDEGNFNFTRNLTSLSRGSMLSPRSLTKDCVCGPGLTHQRTPLTPPQGFSVMYKRL